MPIIAVWDPISTLLLVRLVVPTSLIKGRVFLCLHIFASRTIKGKYNKKRGRL